MICIIIDLKFKEFKIQRVGQSYVKIPNDEMDGENDVVVLFQFFNNIQARPMTFAELLRTSISDGVRLSLSYYL